jgi:CheY-like chemotaxis protein
MPEVGGLEAAHAIRTYESLAGAQNQKKLPIIAMSADATDDLEYRCLAVGMSGMTNCMGGKRAPWSPNASSVDSLANLFTDGRRSPCQAHPERASRSDSNAVATLS